MAVSEFKGADQTGVKAGAMDRKIEILLPTKTQSISGQEIITWAHKFWAWASILPMGGSEKFRFNRDLGVISYRVQMRYNKTLTIEDGVRFNGIIYDIISIAPTGRRTREKMELIVEKVSAKGLEE